MPMKIENKDMKDRTFEVSYEIRDVVGISSLQGYANAMIFLEVHFW